MRSCCWLTRVVSCAWWPPPARIPAGPTSERAAADRAEQPGEHRTGWGKLAERLGWTWTRPSPRSATAPGQQPPPVRPGPGVHRRHTSPRPGPDPAAPASHPPPAREEARVCFSPQADVAGGLLICAIGVDAVCHRPAPPVSSRWRRYRAAWCPSVHRGAGLAMAPRSRAPRDRACRAVGLPADRLRRAAHVRPVGRHRGEPPGAGADYGPLRVARGRDRCDVFVAMIRGPVEVKLARITCPTASGCLTAW